MSTGFLQSMRKTGQDHADGRRSQRYLTNYGLGLAMVDVTVCIVNFASAIGGNPAGFAANVVCLAMYLAAIAAAVVRRTARFTVAVADVDLAHRDTSRAPWRSFEPARSESSTRCGLVSSARSDSSPWSC